MSVSRDTSKGTWTVYARYTDWQGKVKVLHKRGFKIKREAVEYEREFLLKKAKDVNMGFAQFVECYLEDLKPRLKYNTYLTKEHIIRTKILPYFEDKALADICTSDIMQWQNEILQMRDDDGKGYSPTYLKTISAQMSAIFNHATRYFGCGCVPFLKKACFLPFCRLFSATAHISIISSALKCPRVSRLTISP